MIEGNKILAIIPARGGSKGLPGKNIKTLLGKPLIGWTIEQAKASKFIDEVFVTTDSLEIVNVVNQFGIDVPFLRPEELSNDTASSVDVVEHVLNHYKTLNKVFDYIILCEPTSPLRKRDDFDNAVMALSKNKQSDGIISVGEVHMEHPLIVKKIGQTGKLEPYINDAIKVYQRQQADKAYFPYGVIYMIKTSVFLEKRAFYTENIMPYIIERWQNYEVDDIYDFECIETIMKMMKEVFV